MVPLTGWVEKDGGGRGLAEGVFCVLLRPLTNGEEPAWDSLKLPDLFAAGVEKKLAAFDLDWVIGGGDGSSMNDWHSESRCLFMSGSLTGLSHIGQATIGTGCRDMCVVLWRFHSRTVLETTGVCRHKTRDAIKVQSAPRLRGSSPIIKMVYQGLKFEHIFLDQETVQT